MIYQWRDGSRFKSAPQGTGEFLEKVAKKHEGVLTAGVVVDAARSNKSIIHGEFEWDNEVAAEDYRKEQARLLLRSLVTVQTVGKTEQAVRTYFVVHEGESRAYVPTLRILSDTEMRGELLSEALSALKSLQRKYAMLTELTPVWAALQQAEVIE